MGKQGHVADLRIISRKQLYNSKVCYLHFNLLLTTDLPNMSPQHDFDNNSSSLQYQLISDHQPTP